jgi:putative chitinase
MTASITAELLIQAMDQAGLADLETRAGIAAIVSGESGMQGYSEEGYAHTPNARIREVYGSRVASLSDAQLDAAKADDRAFFDLVYGGAWGAENLGNTEPDDGYNFRGRGLIQLTGRSNYTRYAGKIGQEAAILANPDLANDPATAASLAVAYIVDRYKGGGFAAMMKCVGNNTPDIAATKERYYQQFLASGEFASRAAT